MLPLLPCEDISSLSDESSPESSGGGGWNEICGAVDVYCGGTEIGVGLRDEMDAKGGAGDETRLGIRLGVRLGTQVGGRDSRMGGL